MPSTKNLGAMVVKLEADSAQMRRELRLIEGRVGKSAQSMQSSFGSVTSRTAALRGAVSKLHVGVAALAGTTGIGLAVKSALDFADGIEKTASKLGVTTDFLQEARFAADQSGVAINTLEMAMQRFTRRAAEAANGTGEAKDAIKELGVELRGTDGQLRSTESLFRDAVAALAKVPNEGERLRLAFKLFDSEGAVLVNLAKNFETLSAEAKAAGQVLGGETIRRAVEAKDEFSKLSTEIKIQTTEALVDLAPLLTDTAGRLAVLAHNAGVAWARLRDLFNADPKNLRETSDRADEVRREIERLDELRQRAARIEENPGSLRSNIEKVFVPGSVESYTRRIKELSAELHKLDAQAARLRDAGNTPVPAIPEAPKPEPVEASPSADAVKEAKDREKLIESIRRQAEEHQRLLNAKVRGGEALERELAQIAIENEVRRLGTNATAAQIEEVERLAEAREAASREFEGIEESGVKASDEILGSVERLRDGMGSAFVRMALDGENAFKSLGDSFVRDFLSRVVQQKLFNPIFDSFGLGTRAAGGPVSAGQPYLVGERGPEIVVPGANSFVIPNHKIGAATGGSGTSLGGDVNIYVQNNAGADVGVSDSSGPGGSREISIAIEQAAARGMARGAMDGPMLTRFGFRPKGRAGA